MENKLNIPRNILLPGGEVGEGLVARMTESMMWSMTVENRLARTRLPHWVDIYNGFLKEQGVTEEYEKTASRTLMSSSGMFCRDLLKRCRTDFVPFDVALERVSMWGGAMTFVIPFTNFGMHNYTFDIYVPGKPAYDKKINDALGFRAATALNLPLKVIQENWQYRATMGADYIGPLLEESLKELDGRDLLYGGEFGWYLHM